MDFMKENYKWIGAALFLIFRIICGYKRRSPGDWEKFVKSLGGFGPIVEMLIEFENIPGLHGTTKKSMAAAKIQEVYKKITGQELPLDMANLIVELGLQELKEIICKNQKEKTD